MSALLLVLAPAVITPCDDPLADPIATPIRETDMQRGACLRDEVSVEVTSHALIDTPNFHGVIGGDVALAARFVVHDRLELDARLRLVDTLFVQTAVNKVTAVRFGPLALGAMVSLDPSLSLVAFAELPFTRDEMATLHASGQLALAFTTALSSDWRMHARLGGVGVYASSDGGDTSRFALRAGSDLVWQPHARIAFDVGADVEAGWRDGLSMVLARAGCALRVHRAHRLVLGVGIPLGGDEPTTAVATITVGRDL